MYIEYPFEKKKKQRKFKAENVKWTNIIVTNVPLAMHYCIVCHCVEGITCISPKSVSAVTFHIQTRDIHPVKKKKHHHC